MNIIQVVKMVIGIISKNGMSPIQFIQMLQGNMPPEQVLGVLNNMFGNNPNLQRALQMGKGKSVNELQDIAKNLCNESGLDFDGLRATAGKFGIKI